MPPQGPSRRIQHRRNPPVGESTLRQLLAIVFLAVLMTFTVYAAESIATNASRIAAEPQSGHRFMLFRNLRWYPMRPQSEAWIDNLTLAFFVAVPCLIAVALKMFFGKSRAIQQSGWRRLVAGNGLILVFLLSTLLLAAEVRFRFFMDTTDSLGFTKISERWVVRHWHPNGAGCRDNIEYSPRIQPGKRRVSFVGDSFTAGHGIKNVDDRFANRLRALHPDWEIHLLANVGLDTGNEITLLEKALSRDYQLDEVVLVYCLNDVCDLLMAPRQPYEGRLPAIDERGPWFTRGSYFLDLIYNRYKAAQNPYVRDYFAFVKGGYRGEYWQKQQARLKELRDLVQSHGGHLTVVTFPFLHALGPNYEYKFVHEELNRLWTDLKVPHLELLPMYAGLNSSALTINAHDAHPNELANKLAAEAINRVLWPEFTNRVQAVSSRTPAER
jgi:lysophospholipase L1-like esterase